jgi:hypothetical protein
MAEQTSGDMDGQSAGDGLGREDPSEVVRREVQGLACLVGEGSSGQGVVE